MSNLPRRSGLSPKWAEFRKTGGSRSDPLSDGRRGDLAAVSVPRVRHASPRPRFDGGGRPVPGIGYPPCMSTLSTTLCGVPLRNPIVAAAGTVGYGPEIAEVFPVSRLGALTTKSITPECRDGNPPWRVTDLPVGMLNAIGLANPGLDRFMGEVLPELDGLDTVVIGSIAGHRVEDYVEVATAFGSEAARRLALVELNVSCPNATGRQFGDDPGLRARSSPRSPRRSAPSRAW